MSLVDERFARLVRATVAIVAGDWPALRAERRAEGAAPEPGVLLAWRETLLQAHLFAGFPRVIEAWERVEEEGGLGAPGAAEQEPLGPAPPERAERGAALFARIYGPGAADVRARLAAFHPDLGRWIAEHAYGRALVRPGLSPAQRELLAVAALVASGQERQLASHARGAVRCGASPADVRALPSLVGDLVEPERLERARAVLERFAR